MISYANGRFIETSEVSLPFFDDMLGTLRGYRFFTTCMTHNHRVFRLDDHVDRLFEMAKTVYMQLPHPREELIRILMDVVFRNRHLGQELFLIVFYSGGAADATGMLATGPARCYVLASPLKGVDQSLYQTGVSLATYPFQRHFPTVKLFDYMGALMAQHEVVSPRNAYGPLFVSLGPDPQWLEGSTYNVFGVKDGVLITPALDGRILSGITRKVILELAASAGISCEERTIFMSETSACSEMFLTSSTRGILPVVRVDDAVIGAGCVGEISATLMSAFNAYLDQH